MWSQNSFKKIILSIIGDDKLSPITSYLRRHFEYVVPKKVLPHQINIDLDNIFATTFLRRLSLQNMWSQILYLHRIICDDVLATTCRHEKCFSDGFLSFAMTFCRRKKLLL